MAIEHLRKRSDQPGQRPCVDLHAILIPTRSCSRRPQLEPVTPTAHDPPALVRHDGQTLLVDRIDRELMSGERQEPEQEGPAANPIAHAPRTVEPLGHWVPQHPARNVNEGVRGLERSPDDVGRRPELSGHTNGFHCDFNMRALLVSVDSHTSRTAEPRKRPRQARSRALVQSILESAARVFEERGYHDTNTNDVAELAGVSIGSLYQYFPNKDALLVGLAEQHLEEALPRLRAIAEELRTSAPEPEPLCRAFIAAAADLNRSHRLHHLLATAPRTEALVERVEQLHVAMSEEVSWHLQRIGHPAEHAGARARVLVVAVDAVVHSRSPHPQQDLIEELVRLCRISMENHST